ncbi:MAG TPA: hypothetical protein VGA43_08035, partial [Deferrimonas sp.]
MAELPKDLKSLPGTSAFCFFGEAFRHEHGNPATDRRSRSIPGEGLLPMNRSFRPGARGRSPKPTRII